MAVSYCGVGCQKADWGTHKTTCKPCNTYAFEQARIADKAKDWRKTLKWSGFFEALMMRHIQPGIDVDNLRRHVLRVFAFAYERAADATGEPHYAHKCLPILREQIALYGKYEYFDLQVESICVLGRLLSMTLENNFDEQVVACFQQARDVWTAHRSAFAEFKTSVALGQIARAQGRHADAINLLRAAVAASKVGNGTESFATMATREMDASSLLIEMLLETGAYDEAEALALRFPSVLRTAYGFSPPGLVPQQLYAHLQLAQVHDARGRPEDMAREVRILIDLVNKNNDAVVEWRHGLGLILQDVYKLTLPGPDKGWNDDLLVLVDRVAEKYGVHLNATGSDGTKWEQIFI
jgi:tetratricopeptide (TPR) repeat protein